MTKLSATIPQARKWIRDVPPWPKKVNVRYVGGDAQEPPDARKCLRNKKVKVIQGQISYNAQNEVLENPGPRKWLHDVPTWQKKSRSSKVKVRKCREPSRDPQGCSPRPTWRVHVTYEGQGHPRSKFGICTKSVSRALKCSDMTP